MCNAVSVAPDNDKQAVLFTDVPSVGSELCELCSLLYIFFYNRVYSVQLTCNIAADCILIFVAANYVVYRC